jgi:hypothetical protein
MNKFSRRDVLTTGGVAAAAFLSANGSSSNGRADAQQTPLHHDDNVIAKSINSDTVKVPTLYARLHNRHIAFCSTIFPSVPGLRLDACVYEPGDGFLKLNLMGVSVPADNTLVYRHSVKSIPGLIHETTFTADTGTVEAVGRLTLDSHLKPSDLRVPENLPTPNLCWCFQKSPNLVAGGSASTPYGERPNVYPTWVQRCFIFTEQGLTFLDKTQRTKTDEVPADDPRNNPVWSQHYIGVWQKAGGESLPVNTSHTRYVAPVIGAVSNDGKYLIGLASESPRYIAQAWHTCLHHVVTWGPTSSPPVERQWRMKLYAMQNEPVVLMARVASDFPSSMRLRDHVIDNQ